MHMRGCVRLSPHYVSFSNLTSFTPECHSNELHGKTTLVPKAVFALQAMVLGGKSCKDSHHCQLLAFLLYFGFLGHYICVARSTVRKSAFPML